MRHCCGLLATGKARRRNVEPEGVVRSSSWLRQVPIHIKRKETGGLSVAVPLLFKDGRQAMQQLQPRLEVDATLERKE